MVARHLLAATLVASGLARARDDGQLVDEAFGPSVDVAKSRGPQIFNAVHDSMRQVSIYLIRTCRGSLVLSP